MEWDQDPVHYSLFFQTVRSMESCPSEKHSISEGARMSSALIQAFSVQSRQGSRP